MKQILIIITALFLTTPLNIKAGFPTEEQTGNWLLRNSEGDGLIDDETDEDDDLSLGKSGPVSDALPFVLALAGIYCLEKRRKKAKE